MRDPVLMMSSIGADQIAELRWETAWKERSTEYEALFSRCRPLTECGLRQELIFCLLGGHGVSYELARSATDVVMGLCPFEVLCTTAELGSLLQAELREAKFDPRRKDGSLRRYRYPTRKAELIAAAVGWVKDEGGLATQLGEIRCEQERRNWLCSCPGIGPKSASWLLRNSGHAEHLAILDVHVMRAMREAGRIGAVRLPQDYDLAEECFVTWCKELGASVASFDLFLWEWQRGDIDQSAV